MAVKCYETVYKNFGRCVCLENEQIILIVTVEIGPRIIYFSTRGHDNILFEDIDRDFYEINKGYGIWYAYGGHRLWSAPEVMPETYLPDASPVEYSFENNVLTLIPPKTAAGKQFMLAVEMGEGNSVQITNSITNCTDAPLRFAPWSVTGLSGGGLELIPLSAADNGFLPNRAIALWSYTHLGDPRFTLTNGYATLRHDTEAAQAFKVGFSVEDCRIWYAAKGQLFCKTFESAGKVDYPDFGCNFETYTNRHFIECELLGEQRDYAPGESAVIRECWEITEAKDTPDDVIAGLISAL